MDNIINTEKQTALNAVPEYNSTPEIVCATPTEYGFSVAPINPTNSPTAMIANPNIAS